MRITVHHHHSVLPPELAAYLNEKLGKLEELLGKSRGEHAVDVHVRDAGLSEGKPVTEVSASIVFQGKNIFTEEKGSDVRTLIDAVQEELRRQLIKSKERPVSLARRGGLRAKHLGEGEGPHAA